MPKFKGFQDYIEIFKGGRQIDSSGKEHDGDALIDTAVAKFNAAVHEPPAVAGHPRDNAPAYGWVESLKAEVVNGAKVLMARFKEVAPEFEALVKAGRFKKRSAAFYPDGTLRHVGFLGAMPPAVKGLADIGFGEGEPVVFEFFDHQQSRLGRIFSRLREWIIEKEGIDTADRIIPDWDVDEMKQEASRPEETTSGLYTENDTTEVTMEHDKQFSEAEVAVREAAAAIRAKEEGKKEAQLEFAEAERKREIETFIARNFPKEGAGVLPPALLDSGVKRFMEQLGGETIEFSEGKRESPLAWFMNFLEGLPASGLFTEVATRDKDFSTGAAGARIAELLAKKRAAKPDLPYSAAFSEVQVENPDLAREYLAEMGR